MASFNVLKEPWIPVKLLTGEQKEMGILEVFEKAHLFACVQDPSPLFEYGIYRLLTVFLMDAFEPEISEDIEDLLANGFFPMEQIYKYIDECEKDGPCFDLFDTKKPFLQTAFDPKWDSNKTIKPIAAMLHELPGGNNHVHFTHSFESTHVLSPAVCAKALCAVNVFCTAGLQGPSSVNGAPPLYMIINSDNLFELLLLNCIPSSKTPLKYNAPKVYWRQMSLVEPGNRIAITSLLAGMTMMARRINLIPDERGGTCTQTGNKCDVVVENVYFQKGLNFEGYDSWRDPHVSYSISDKGRVSIKPQLGKECWRNIGNIFALDQRSPDIINQYIKTKENDKPNIPIITYGLVTNQAQYETWLRDEISLDIRIVKDDGKMAVVNDCIKSTENVAFELRKQLRNIVTKHKHTSQEQLIEQSSGQFFATCRGRFFSVLCNSLAQADISKPNEGDTIVSDWNDFLKRSVYKEFNDCADRLGISAKDLLNSAQASRNLSINISKILKGDK